MTRPSQVGDVVVGTVQSVKPYGAFVDIGGVNGLLHISQISEDRVTNVEAVLSEGDKLKVGLQSRMQTASPCCLPNPVVTVVRTAYRSVAIFSTLGQLCVANDLCTVHIAQARF